MNTRGLFALLGFFAPLLGTVAAADQPAPKTPIRVGIIGLDAHAVPWTQILTDRRPIRSSAR